MRTGCQRPDFSVQLFGEPFDAPTYVAIAAGTLRGAALAAFADEIAPIDDVRSTARYRRRVSENLLAAFVAEL